MKNNNTMKMENKVYHICDYNAKPLCMSKFEKLMRESLGQTVNMIQITYAHWSLDEHKPEAEWCLKCREKLARLGL